MYTSLGASLNVAYLYGVYEKPQSVEMVMELCTGGELWRRIKKGKYSEKGEECGALVLYSSMLV